uniref:Uncharacterized protein n=1 Tax=Denticeps clupeoides TaxID=299321 RepID=A0AAY4BTJ5_9TELE
MSCRGRTVLPSSLTLLPRWCLRSAARPSLAGTFTGNIRPRWASSDPLVWSVQWSAVNPSFLARPSTTCASACTSWRPISERRTERLCNPSLSELPAFLGERGRAELRVHDRPLHRRRPRSVGRSPPAGGRTAFRSGSKPRPFLRAVSENKVLCHPSSDHVSMGGWAARKALRVWKVVCVCSVLAIELLAACQGIEFLRPLRTTTPLEKVYDLVRSVVKPWIKDRFMAPDIEAIHRLLLDQKIWNIAKPYIDKYRMEHIPESRPSSPTAFSLESPGSPAYYHCVPEQDT